ncbi:Hint domain-containing protein [Poseidonocella sp. HB161398]|uniref:Hint domain-containing protein n=1 Tax=Poseidonocella sp. HB161398 TaxID=2320855 RepID=UPI001107EB09|nr:Hint domain-containing protein [Poseidonocella sp. HB161398]
MANSYDTYTSTSLGVGDLLNVNLDLLTFAENTSVTIADNSDGAGDDTNILDLNEEFTGPDGGILADDQYEYLGNLVDSNGDTIGFVASGPGLLLGNTTIFVPAGTDLSGVTFTAVDTSSGWQVEEAAANCFVGGTLISTPEGQRPVEFLGIGDLVLTAAGKPVPVKWIGRQKIRNALARSDMADRLAPICIREGALGEGVPLADLYLSADHGVVVDDLLVNAGALVNGRTILQVPLAEMPEEFTYYHVETQDHDEILANGAAAETLIDYVGRRAFDNFSEYMELYGCERIVPEMRRLRISASRQLPQHIASRFGIGSFAEAVEDEFRTLMETLSAA